MAIGAGIVATGAVVASAASLGTLNVKTLGTNSAAVTPCATDTVNVAWNASLPTYVNTGTYNTNSATVTAPSACNGATIKVTAAQGDGTPLSESTTTTISSGTASLTFPTAFNSKLVENVTVTIYNQN